MSKAKCETKRLEADRVRALYDVLWQVREVLTQRNLDGSATLSRKDMAPLKAAVAAFDAVDAKLADARRSPGKDGSE